MGRHKKPEEMPDELLMSGVLYVRADNRIPVEVTFPHACNCCAAIHDAEKIEAGPYHLIERQPERGSDG